MPSSQKQITEIKGEGMIAGWGHIHTCIFIFIYTIISSGGLVVLRGEGQKKKAYRGEFVRGHTKKRQQLNLKKTGSQSNFH